MYNRIIIVFLFSFNLCIGQLDNHYFTNIQFSSLKEPRVNSSSSNIIGLPIFNFNAQLVTNINHIMSISNQDLLIDFSSTPSNDIFLQSKITNNLFFYGQQQDSVFYSIGLDHKVFMDINISQDLFSLMIDGNQQYLNKSHTFTNNHINIYNYLSLYFGYARNFSSLGLAQVKLKLIKGLSLIQNSQSDILTINTVDNFNTEDVPFTTSLYTDFTFLTNYNSNLFSDLGLALDVSLEYDLSNQIALFAHIYDLGFVYWNTDRYVSHGNYDFPGIAYTLDENIMTELNNVYDTMVNIFDIQKKNDTHFIQLLPYEINLGSSYRFVDSDDKLILNYQLNKMTNFIYGTASIGFYKKYNQYKLSIMPIYMINKFNYSNISIVIHKQWSTQLMSQLFFQNIISPWLDDDYYTSLSAKFFFMF